jgi:hypothetical protein
VYPGISRSVFNQATPLLMSFTPLLLGSVLHRYIGKAAFSLGEYEKVHPYMELAVYCQQSQARDQKGSLDKVSHVTVGQPVALLL